MKPQLGDIDWLVGELIPPSLGSLLLYQFSLLALPQYTSLPIKLPSEMSLKGHTEITTVVKNDLAILRRKNFCFIYSQTRTDTGVRAWRKNAQCR